MSMLSFRARSILLMGFVLATGTARPVVAQGPPEGFPDLVSGLRAIEGNLGVETAQTASGKQVIFAWFKDKESVLRWYHSEMHQNAQDMFFPNRPEHEPLAHVPDDVGPILAIASITPADSAHLTATSLPISQIAIELYAPLPGGLSLGGTFAPAALEVPHMMELGPKGEHEHSER
jgi:hypothetical protein